LATRGSILVISNIAVEHLKTVVQVRVTIVKKTFEHIRNSATLALREVKVRELRV
jgi:hypothetical protein